MVAGGALVLSAIAGTGGVGQAHDHDAPIVRLRADRQHQEGIPREIWWVDQRGDDECVGWNEVGPGDFPPSMEVGEGERARIRFHKRHKPMDVSIIQWQRLPVVDEVLLGPADEVDFVLQRRKGKNGTTRFWDAVFERPGPGEYLYEAFAQWRDRQGCRSEQGGFWRFSLSVGP